MMEQRRITEFDLPADTNEQDVVLAEYEAYSLVQAELRDGQQCRVELGQIAPIEYSYRVFEEIGMEGNALLHIRSGIHEYWALDFRPYEVDGQPVASPKAHRIVIHADPREDMYWKLKINAEFLLVDKALWRAMKQRGIDQGCIGVRRGRPTLMTSENERCRRRFPYIADANEAACSFEVAYDGKSLAVAADAAAPITVSWLQRIPGAVQPADSALFDPSAWFDIDRQMTVFLPYAELNELVAQAKAGRFASVHDVVDLVLTSRLAWEDAVRAELASYGVIYSLPYDESSLFPGQIAVRMPQDHTKWLIVR